MKWLANLRKPIEIVKVWEEIVAKLFDPIVWTDDFEYVTDYPIADVLPLSYDGEYGIDSSFRFLDSNNAL